MHDLIKALTELPEIWKSVITICAFTAVFLIYSGVSKRINRKKAGNTEGAALKEASRGNIKLIDTDEKTAALVMDMISEKTGVPLEKLDIKSIRQIGNAPSLEGVSEEEAAVIMAVTSYRTGTPLQNLSFRSIKLVSN